MSQAWGCALKKKKVEDSYKMKKCKKNFQKLNLLRKFKKYKL